MADDPNDDTAPIPPVRRGRGKGKRGGDRSTEDARVEAVTRQRQVMRLRLAGVDFETIAEQLGYADRSGAAKAWRRGMREAIRPLATETVDLQLDRLDALLRATMPKALAGNLAAVDRVLAIERDRRKLLGVEGAVKLDVTSDDARAEVAQVLGELAGVLYGGQPLPP